VKYWRGELPSLVDFIEKTTRSLGMLWKVEAHRDYRYATFHKGFWVKGVEGHIWLPLPSCLWKATKIRCDTGIPWEELMLRLAFNLYQRIINNNVSTVSMISAKMFHYIVETQMPKLKQRYAREASSLGDLSIIMAIYTDNSKVGQRFKRFVDTSYLNKSGETIQLTPDIARGGNNWDREQEIDFMQYRYGLDDQDLRNMLGEGVWNGEFGIVRSLFMRAAIQRDYGSTADSFEDDLMYREEGGHVEPALVQ